MSARSPVTCHILDTQFGKPAANVAVTLFRLEGGGSSFNSLAESVTDADGRCTTLLPPQTLMAGTYKMHFATKSYFESTGRETFFPFVEIVFDLKNPDQHYHIPLLLSAFSYTTYRGS
ncbi:5-hydroxyisourate hydrolase {ECO:0000256/RuleBase:RU361270} Short=HIU hydrolase {ECO:0000256/RuleBase:RU361270}; Short=HIUHase {ECO:0000256/RuleBase:RU361270}; {ECO:0000256/RuleBase:RU361270} [Serendipita indica DSM 11827]|uniref:5-hydroxyisourate hydrolase n=1 Tax=Serendipita indica (strain DSM 11827) TaxID=1109443 RepID=G4T733_SERID|nr:5-hydroxyisourate hydrolase {ECO:0000256/RuleBase:RU361270} Short=HIU hydrolase {ECO:0000256/RuleBase:RU361270}; Short=HIUHase {ECO:0000256/RuleBase:RU361270}; {ECO:0000256/RuleBase:RU361270} [Serendipita indica DSM 11827]CCA67165.1 related to transthyretin-Cryptococcus neoformans [Serendipita indica DSM 11827]